MAASQKFAVDRSRDGLEMITLLLESRALPDVRKMGSDHSTALHEASRRGAVDIVLWCWHFFKNHFLKKLKYVILQFFCYFCFEVKILLSHNASPKEVDAFGHTPLHVILKKSTTIKF